MTVGLVDENYRKAWYARFAYGAYYENGQFVGWRLDSERFVPFALAC
jgi:hypothetical protein